MSENGIGSKVVTQIAIVVHDIERSIDRVSHAFGMAKPEIIITDTVDKARTNYRGASSPAQAKLAFFHLGQVDLELIEPVGGPSIWQEHLDTKGEGVHHIAFAVPDTAAAVTALKEQGMADVQHGYFEGGMYTYVDTAPQLGVMLELLEFFGK